jgi:hypothetical protein
MMILVEEKSIEIKVGELTLSKLKGNYFTSFNINLNDL